MKRLLALLLSLVLLVSAVPATADDELNWLYFETPICDLIFADMTPAATFEEELQALVACFLLIEYTSAYDDEIADYISIDGCYIGYLDDTYWCAFPNVTNDTILSIVHERGTSAQATILEGFGEDDSLATIATRMGNTLTEYREVTIGEINLALNAILDLISDD